MSAPPVESMDEVNDEAKELSAALARGTGIDVVGVSAPSTSFFRVLRQLPTDPDRRGVADPDLVSTISSE